MKIVSQIVALVLVLTGCSKDRSRGFGGSALRNAVAKNEVIDLKRFTPFAWDRVHVFAPYAPPDTIKSEVGQDVPFPHASSEGYCLLVFLAGGAVVASLEVQRSDADFSQLHRSGGYTPEEAIFTVKQTPSGWKHLERATEGAARNSRRAQQLSHL